MLFLACEGNMQDSKPNQGNPKSPTLAELKFTTPAYQAEALRLLIEEANVVAKELGLPEQLPITQSSLIEIIIPPPRVGAAIGLGNISTSNYTYYIHPGQKFALLTKAHLIATYESLEANRPVGRIPTNVFQIATQMLAAVEMDVSALNRDCDVNTEAYVSKLGPGINRTRCLVTWQRRGPVPNGNPAPFLKNAARIEFLLETRELLLLRVFDRRYNLRRPVEIKNLQLLLERTNDPSGPVVPR